MPMMIALKAATPQLPRTTAVADHVVAVDETDSTNALAVQMIGDGSLTLPDHQDGELAVAVVAATGRPPAVGAMVTKWVSQPGRCSTMSYAVRIPRAIATDESVNGWLPDDRRTGHAGRPERHDRGIRCRAEPAGLLAGTQMAERRVLPRAQAGRAALGTGDSAVVRYRY